MTTDPAAAAAVDAIVARILAVYARWGRGTTIAQMRADWDALHGADVDAAVVPVDAGGVRCEWLHAHDARVDRTIVYLHGGGFQIGSLRSHRRLMADLSAAAGVRVLGVDFRLAPEHRYPAALDDAGRVLDWLERQGIPMAQVALAGDSAGGGLALSCMLERQQRAAPLPVAALLMSPLTDLTVSGASYDTQSAADPIHQRPMIEAIVRTYLGKAQDPRAPLASPMWADAGALAALPPLLVQVGHRETLLSDAEDFATRVRAAGGNVQCQVWPGMIHVFQQFAAELAPARDAISIGGRFLAAHLGLDGHPDASATQAHVPRGSEPPIATT